MSKIKLLAFASGIVLSACGGGGGGSVGPVGTGSGTDGGAASNSWLSFSPTQIAATAYAGESQEILVDARSSQRISEVLNAAVIDRTGTFSKLSVYKNDFETYRASLEVSPGLPIGLREGTVEVRLCRDSAVTCANPYPGSPWQIPYRINVQAATDLKPLRPLAGAGAWTHEGGNASRNGYVPANVNPADFTRRFKWLNDRPYVSGNVAVDNGQAFWVSGAASGTTLRALSEATGQVQWSAAMSTSDTNNVPAIIGSRVFLSSGEYRDPSPLRIFDAANGAPLGQIGTPGSRATSPLVHLGKVYVSLSGSSASRMARIDGVTGSLDWKTDLARVERRAAYAVNGTNVYVHDGFALQVIRPADGSVINKIADPRTGGTPGYGFEDTLVLDGVDGAYLAHHTPTPTVGSRLIRFDLARGAVSWEQIRMFTGNPVIAEGVLYINTTSALEARSPATGALLWSWTAGPSLLEPLLIIGKHAFIGAFDRTYAIDLTTRQAVWSYPSTGQLAVSSNGVLYITRSGQTVAINLH